MSDIMRPIPFDQLMNWVFHEYQDHGSVFGVSKLVRHSDGASMPIFDEKIEAPFGPAAGPHTQLAQNLIAAYAAGCRFFELKTVQVMDGEELSRCVAKPCITAADECYNCEWSTELTVPQAFEEYVKGWFACKLLAKELALGDPDGFVFNMSVGYDLKGIQSEKIDAYIEGMKNAAGTPVWQTCMDWALAHLEQFTQVDAAFVRSISPQISRSITESTLHGCPPHEIERIATYLITQKGLHTYVKCNPTLLGYDFARKTLDSLGFGYVTFDGHHFAEDLQFSDAAPMFRRLTALTKECGLEFGVKLTNTFPVEVAAGELPSEEMYMSGRALYPLTIALAAKIAQEFHGQLRISYSGGADFHNIAALYAGGIWPITMATTALKPGGYQRFSQIGNLLMNGKKSAFTGVDAAAVEGLSSAFYTDEYYRKPIKPMPTRKLNKKVPLLDCFTAPCRGGCPIGQDIPAYLRLVDEGKLTEALDVITQRNPLPFITGTICPHHCGDQCTRTFYEDSVHIRSVKLYAAVHGYDALLPTLTPAAPVAGKKVAVVGGGPAGLAAAWFLTRAGVAVTIFEGRDSLGGIVRHVIPEFRIAADAIDHDIALVKAMGAEVQLNTQVKSAQALLDQGYTHVIFATGAWAPGDAGLAYGQAINVLAFLEQAKKDPAALSLGSDVVVIGGGNTAMDAARAAKRVPGVAHVRLVYRRTKRYMPADEEELALALADGVAFMELLAPVGVKDGVLTCQVMELGAPDASGRRSPVDTGRTTTVPATAVITAVGERVDAALLGGNGITLERGRPVADGATMETEVANVYVVGDACRGPATVVEAIADATAAAWAIAGVTVDGRESQNVNPNPNPALAKKGDLCTGDCTEAQRCLECATVCACCADVCPNRANVVVTIPGGGRQIVHVDGMCNECGNCATFCPYDSHPYRDKLTLFWSREDFDNSTNEGWLPRGDGSGRCLVRLDGQVGEYDTAVAGCALPQGVVQVILAVRDGYGYLVKDAEV